MFTQVPATSAPAASAPATSGGTVEERPTTLKTPAASESVPGGTLVVAAYAIVWIVVLLLIVLVFQKQSLVSKRVDELEAELKKKR